MGWWIAPIYGDFGDGFIIGFKLLTHLSKPYRVSESSWAHAEAKDTFAPPVVDFWEGLSEDRLRDGTGPLALIWATVNIYYLAECHQFLKSVLSFFRFWATMFVFLAYSMVFWWWQATNQILPPTFTWSAIFFFSRWSPKCRCCCPWCR